MITLDNLSPISCRCWVFSFLLFIHHRFIFISFYLFTSQISLPPSISGHYSERIVYLPKTLSYIVNDHLQMQGHTLSQPRAPPPPPLNGIGEDSRNQIGICEEQRQNLEMEDDRNISSTCVNSSIAKSKYMSVCLSSCSRLIIIRSPDEEDT